MTRSPWLRSYSRTAALSDRFGNREDHVLLIAAGLLGEAGSILAEIKKMTREQKAYPVYQQRLCEEIGDFLWYYVRFVDLFEPRSFGHLVNVGARTIPSNSALTCALDLGALAGDALRLVRAGDSSELGDNLENQWQVLNELASATHVALRDAAEANIKKTQSRWPPARSRGRRGPQRRGYAPLFDRDYPREEQIPRELRIEFLERQLGDRIEVLLRSGGINLGSRLTDNITDRDDYRYHDIFHMSYAVFVGWSPVTRSLLRCKRKSRPAIDENQDGARAVILEEAISAIIFSRAKNMAFFEGLNQVDYDLLKNVQEFTRGYEVEAIPVWQWEKAILEGYRVFRLLRDNGGGYVHWDMRNRKLSWRAPRAQSR